MVPLGSVSRSVSRMGTLIPVMLYVFSGAPLGHNPSGRVLDVFSPSHAVPVWRFAENGGRMPRCGLSSGQAGRPLLGLNMICGLTPGVGDSKSGQTVSSSGSPEYTGADEGPPLCQSHTVASVELLRTPRGGSWPSTKVDSRTWVLVGVPDAITVLPS